MSGWGEVRHFTPIIGERHRSIGTVILRPSRLDRDAIEHLRMRRVVFSPFRAIAQELQ
jgi:hypothetical protein